MSGWMSLPAGRVGARAAATLSSRKDRGVLRHLPGLLLGGRHCPVPLAERRRWGESAIAHRGPSDIQAHRCKRAAAVIAARPTTITRRPSGSALAVIVAFRARFGHSARMSPTASELRSVRPLSPMVRCDVRRLLLWWPCRRRLQLRFVIGRFILGEFLL